MEQQESVLKKQFKEADVTRLRNLIQGKHGEKSTIGVGYNKEYIHHAEGDIWEEDGRTWTIINSIKQNITKLDLAKQQLHLPLFCPSCSSLMKHRYDKQFFIQFNRCFNCQINYEAKLKLDGNWLEKEKEIHNSDIDNTIKDFEIYMDEIINSSNESFITEAGDIEKWDGSSIKKMQENKEEALKYLKDLRK